jgi:hypothetical protein
MPLTEDDGGVRGEAASLLAERQALVHYLVVRREPTGFEAPHTFFRCGERVLPVFCVREEAGTFIASRDLGKGWHVRGYSVFPANMQYRRSGSNRHGALAPPDFESGASTNSATPA